MLGPEIEPRGVVAGTAMRSLAPMVCGIKAESLVEVDALLSTELRCIVNNIRL